MIKAFIIILVLAFGSCKSSEQQQSVHLPEGNKSGNVITLGSSKSIHYQYGGFNTANLFPNFETNQSECLKIVHQLNPRVLRFPGGSIANFYHPTGKAYGFEENDFTTREGSVSRHVNKMLDKNKRANAQNNYLEDFIPFAKENNASVLYVANITSASEAEIMGIIARFKTEQIPIVGIELGNELYLNAYKEVVPNVEDYIKRASKYAKTIKAQYPDIKVLVATESRSIKNPKFVSQWNVPLAKEKFYDALSLHVYPEFPFCEKTGSLEDILECYHSNLINYIQKTYPEQLELFFNQFPGVDIWITEWNILKPGNYIGNSMAQSLYQSLFFFENLKVHATNSKIPLLSFHNLGASEFGYSAMLSGATNTEVVLNNAYFVFKLFSSINQGNNEWIEVSMSENDSSIKLYALKVKNETHLFIMNLSGENKIIDGIRSEKNEMNVKHFESFSGAKPYSAVSYNGYFNDESIASIDKNILNQIRQCSYSADTKWEGKIQPYSINHITLQQ
ncbi:MAG TPA: hypothetical protein PKH65_08630 [Bacteroidia bacterium]|nr:hypothetical protein [Bacteroidia bacterium]HNT80731.1 hypothetical protein [Bacteroidia bacterium]